MKGLGQHQHTHHSGSWPLRLVPPFTWTEGVSPGSPASLCPCPSTVMAVRGVTPGFGLLRRLCRHTGHRSAPGDPAVTQIGEATGAPFASCLPYREWAATVGAGPGGCPLVRCRHRPYRGQPPQPSLRLRQHQIPWLEFGQSRSHPSRLALILQDHDGFVLLFPTGSCPPSLSRSQPITGPRSVGGPNFLMNF